MSTWKQLGKVEESADFKDCLRCDTGGQEHILLTLVYGSQEEREETENHGCGVLAHKIYKVALLC